MFTMSANGGNSVVFFFFQSISVGQVANLIIDFSVYCACFVTSGSLLLPYNCVSLYALTLLNGPPLQWI